MQLVVLIGQRKAVGIAVHGIKGRRRWSKLKELRSATARILRVISSSRHQEPLSEGPAIPAM